MIEIYYLYQFLGIFYLIFGLGMLLNRHSFYNKAYEGIQRNPSITLIAGMISLVFGYIFVVSGIAVRDVWEVIILILGITALLKSVFLLVFPDVMGKVIQWILNKNIWRGSGILVILFALLFLYIGFIIL